MVAGIVLNSLYDVTFSLIGMVYALIAVVGATFYFMVSLPSQNTTVSLGYWLDKILIFVSKIVYLSGLVLNKRNSQLVLCNY